MARIQSRMVSTGIALFLAGCIVIAVVMALGPGGENTAAPVGDGMPAEAADTDTRPYLLIWSVVGGLGMAAGAALVGVGMHTWRQARRP